MIANKQLAVIEGCCLDFLYRDKGIQETALFLFQKFPQQPRHQISSGVAVSTTIVFLKNKILVQIYIFHNTI